MLDKLAFDKSEIQIPEIDEARPQTLGLNGQPQLLAALCEISIPITAGSRCSVENLVVERVIHPAKPRWQPSNHRGEQ